MDAIDTVLQLANQNNMWSAAQAQAQMDFQERMSNTAHQREIADLKAAGLNPVLSARLGGASTPSGSAASADTSVVGAVVDLLKSFGEGMMSSAASGFASGSRGFDDDVAINFLDPNEVKKAIDRGDLSSQDIRNALAVSSGNSAKGLSAALYSYSQTKLPGSNLARGASSALSKFGSSVANWVRKNGPTNSSSGAAYAIRYADSKNGNTGSKSKKYF